MEAAKSPEPSDKKQRTPQAAPNPPSDYSFVELMEAIPNCSKRDRASQRVNQIRPDRDVWLKDHPHGVEVCGSGSWSGVVSWANIKYAKR